MSFLLHIQLNLSGVDAATHADLLQREHAAAQEHIRHGKLLQIWRTPAQPGNWSIWNADNATELHAMVSALPLYPWMTIAVHPLARHPLADAIDAQAVRA